MDTVILMDNHHPANDPSASIRLWQLISPSLPIGAYAYSQGLETAVEKCWVSNEKEAQNWIEGILSETLTKLDAPVIARMIKSWEKSDRDSLVHWNQFLLACRESSELYHEDQQMGRALWRLLNDVMIAPTQDATNKSEPELFNYYKTLIESVESPSYSLFYSLATVIWKIPAQDSIRGYLWAWCENQIAASIKLVPLGQTAGQRILSHLIPVINQCSSKALELTDDQIGSLAPGFSIVCAQHEVQYTRLFRS